MPRALVLDDDAGVRETVSEIAASEGFVPLPATSLREARSQLGAEFLDLALLDVELPDGRGLELLPEIEPESVVVFMSGHGTVRTAAQAFQGGASEFLEKPLQLSVLRSILRRVRTQAELRDAQDREKDSIVGESPAIRSVRDRVARVAPTECSVLVSGPAGSGKELVARTLHARSGRSRAPFVRVDCAAVSPARMEAELSPMLDGAAARRAGIFARARGGTLFFDEIAAMAVEQQLQLLEIIERESMPGAEDQRSTVADVRIVAATGYDLSVLLDSGALRRELYYRLSGATIELPALRDRPGDVRLLAQAMTTRLAARSGVSKHWSEASLAALEGHDWPGNVRELEHVVERAYVAAGTHIEPRHVRFGPGPRTERESGRPATTTIRAMEKRLILATLEQVGGDKPRAAALLGISLKTLYNRLHAYAVENAF